MHGTHVVYVSQELDRASRCPERPAGLRGVRVPVRRRRAPASPAGSAPAGSQTRAAEIWSFSGFKRAMEPMIGPSPEGFEPFRPRNADTLTQIINRDDLPGRNTDALDQVTRNVARHAHDCRAPSRGRAIEALDEPALPRHDLLRREHDRRAGEPARDAADQVRVDQKGIQHADALAAQHAYEPPEDQRVELAPHAQIDNRYAGTRERARDVAGTRVQRRRDHAMAAPRQPLRDVDVDALGASDVEGGNEQQDGHARRSTASAIRSAACPCIGPRNRLRASARRSASTERSRRNVFMSAKSSSGVCARRTAALSTMRL